MFLISSIFIVCISVGFLLLSMYYPISIKQKSENRFLFKIIVSIYLLDLVLISAIYVNSFSICWGFNMIIMALAFVVWALRDTEILQIGFPNNKNIDLEQNLTKKLQLYMLNGKWEDIVKGVDGISDKEDHDEKDFILMLLMKSYAYIKMNKLEEAMNILFSILDYEAIDDEIKESIKFQMELIQQTEFVA